MKLSIIFTAASLGLASAWNLRLHGTDNREINLHGTLDSGCKTLSFTPALNVDRADFDESTPIVRDPTTFELYVRANCQGLSYRNDPGNHVLTPARVIRSYKVY